MKCCVLLMQTILIWPDTLVSYISQSAWLFFSAFCDIQPLKFSTVFILISASLEVKICLEYFRIKSEKPSLILPVLSLW